MQRMINQKSGSREELLLYTFSVAHIQQQGESSTKPEAEHYHAGYLISYGRELLTMQYRTVPICLARQM